MNDNPISLTDPLGDVVRYDREEGVTRKEFRHFKREIRQMRQNSEAFADMYKEFRKKKNTVYKYVATNTSSGGRTLKTEKGYDMRISVHGKDAYQNGDERLSRIAQVAHETGHAWRKKHGKDPAVPTEPTNIGIGKEAINKMNTYIADNISGQRVREFGAVHIENIVLSELINSGNSNFNGLGLRGSYVMGQYKIPDHKEGVKLIEISEGPEDTLAPPNTREYYLKTHFDIYKEHDVIRPK